MPRPYPFRRQAPLTVFGGIVVATACGLLLAGPHPALALLPGPVLLAGLLLFRRPDLGYYLVVFLIPFGAYRSLPGFPVNARLHWIAAAAVVAVVLIRSLIARRLPAGLASNLWPWLGLWFAVSLVSASASTFVAQALIQVVLLGVAAITIALGLSLLTDAGVQRALPRVLVAAVSTGSFLALLGFYFDLSLFADNAGGGFKRATGAATDPNNLSLMIIFVIPLLWHAFRWAESRAGRLLAVLLLMLNVLALTTTFSRGGAIVFALVTTSMLASRLRRMPVRRLGIALTAAVLAAALIAWAVPPGYWSRQQSLTDPTDRAIGRRASYLAVGWEAFVRRPLLGHGPGAFRDLFARSPVAAEFAKEGHTNRRYAHNTYLEVLTGTGLLGLAAFIGLLLRAWRNFGLAGARLAAAGRRRPADLVGAYRWAYFSLLLYLALFSATYHKLLLVSLPLSQAALNLSRREAAEEIP